MAEQHLVPEGGKEILRGLPLSGMRRGEEAGDVLEGGRLLGDLGAQKQKHLVVGYTQQPSCSNKARLGIFIAAFHSGILRFVNSMAYIYMCGRHTP